MESWTAQRNFSINIENYFYVRTATVFFTKFSNLQKIEQNVKFAQVIINL